MGIWHNVNWKMDGSVKEAGVFLSLNSSVVAAVQLGQTQF